jgi:hypothetical protein
VPGHEMRKSALRRYVVFRIKAMEFLDLNTVRDGLLKGGINYAEHLRPPKFIAQSIRTVVLSYFALFVDKNGLNVIDLWKQVFPDHKKNVEEVWTRIKPTWDTLREFRDRAGFHADKPIKFFDARRKVGMKWGEIETALQEFITLFKFFLSLESKGELPNLETELDSLLDELEATHRTKYQREQFKAYLMIPATNQKPVEST